MENLSLVHCFECNGDYILLDVESGAVHQVDELIARMILFFPEDRRAATDALAARFGAEQVEEAWQELEQLEQAALLFTQPDEALGPKKNQGVVKALCLHVAHDCNMRCAYCFADGGDYGMDRSLMSKETARQAIDFLIQASRNRKNLEIDFFGGEPLVNWDVVVDAVAYGRERERQTGKQIRFTITTNCLALTQDKIDYIDREMANVVLSLDGRPAVHDTLRKTRNGGPSFSLCAPNALRFAKQRGDKEYYVRGTYSANNLDFAQDVLYLHDMGFEQISVEPMVSVDASYRIREEHYPQIRSEYHKLAKACLERRQNGNFINFFHFMMDLDASPCVYKRMLGCGAGMEYLAVSPDGGLYPCHQFVGEEDFKMGQLPQGLLDASITETFYRHQWYNRSSCKNCWARYYCSGGCSASALHMNGSLEQPYAMGCELLKMHLESALWMYAKEHAPED